jgi:hypothetical protein
MGALADIQRGVDRILATAEEEIGQPLTPAARRWAKEQRIFVRVGESARRAILAETGDPDLPETIDGVPLRLTDDFAGFAVEIVE